MKTNLLRTVLEWGLITSLVLSSYFFVRLYFQSKQQRAANGEVTEFQSNNSTMNQLFNELLAYGKTHPDIERLLDPYRQPQAAAPAPAPASAPKPPGK